MRLKSLMALAVTAASLGVIALAQPASAFFWDRPERPAGWGHIHTIHDRDDTSRSNHKYLADDDTDPYAYQPSPRGYYPYYNSGYWAPPRIHRYSGPLPEYYSAWGYPHADYYHVEWHNRHYGGHRRGDW